jgi:hypothetical protein
MPQDTVLYLESSGSDAVREARSSTALGKLLNEPEMHRFGSELRKGFAALKRLAAQGDEEAIPAINAVMPLLEFLLARRVAVNVIGVEKTPQGPEVSAVLAVEVGEEAEAFMKHLETLLKMLPLPSAPKPETVEGHSVQRLELGPIPPLRYGVIEGVFLLVSGEETLKSVLAARSGSAPNLSRNEAFSSALRRLESKRESTAFTLHIDPVRLQAQGRALFTAMSGAADIPPPVSVLLEELGVNSMKSFTYTAQSRTAPVTMPRSWPRRDRPRACSNCSTASRSKTRISTPSRATPRSHRWATATSRRSMTRRCASSAASAASRSMSSTRRSRRLRPRRR